MADEIAPTVISTESPVVTEPPLASVSSSVAAKLEAELENQPPEAPAVTVMEKDVPLSLAAPHPEHPEEKVSIDTAEPQQSKPSDGKRAPISFGSFKEESNKLSDLSDFERKALEELKSLVEAAIGDNTITTRTSSKQPENPPPQVAEPAEKSEIAAEEAGTTSSADAVSIWGIPLMKDERTDVILLKFLRARDFEVKEAFGMLKNTLIWRKEYNVDALIDEELGDDLEKVVFMHGHDKEGHPVCYNLYGEFQNKELYKKTFGDVEKRARFLRWRIQFLEKSIRKLDFRPGGVSTIFQVSDLKNSPGPGKRELRIATRQALHLLQDNYPEFVAKQVFINVPWWYLAFYTMMGPFMTQRTKSKFVFAGPSKTAVTLFKYISPEQVPIQYGGLSTDFCECNPEFTVDDLATEITVKPATKQTVEIIIHEKCVIVWELRVVGWDVSYSAEYVPNTKGSYTVIIQKPKRIASTDEPVITNRFRVAELGKLLLTIDNPTTKKKQLVYRFKVEPLDQ